MDRRRALLTAVTVVAGAACTTTAVLYIAAFASLGAHGPNATGYQTLLMANHAIVIDAVVLAALGLVTAVSAHATLVATGLLAAAAITFTAGAGAEAIGQALLALDPTGRPTEVYSLLLALHGSGADVLPASIVFAFAAMLTVMNRAVRRRRARRSELARA